jgi:hypothetical protein
MCGCHGKMRFGCDAAQLVEFKESGLRGQYRFAGFALHANLSSAGREV